MGTGGSFLRNQDEDDIGNERGSHGVIKRIPIEVKPRGKLGLRSVSSFGNKKNKVGGSLRSALSIDLDPEVEKIRRDFEMYRLNKENEMTSLKKKQERLETENRRLRGELQALQKNCKRCREEKDLALEAEHQALVRAAAFENDRDKIQRQFKIFRETKENEIRTLLRARRELENKLSKLSHGVLDDMDSSSRAGMEMLGTGNPGDWWTALESEPSLGSTSQLHVTGLKGPEFALSTMEMDGPFTNVNKEDWTAAAASLQHIIPNLPDAMASNCISIYISAPADVANEVKTFLTDYEHPVDQLCHWEGRFMTVVCMTPENQDSVSDQFLSSQIEARRRRIEQSSVFVCFLAEHLDRYTELECRMAHLDNPGIKPAVFAFREKEKSNRSKRKASETEEVKKKIVESGYCKVLESYSSPQQAAQFVYTQIDKVLRAELGLDNKKDRDLAESLLEGPEMLCGGCLWDPKQDYEQFQALNLVSKSSCELAFEQYYERLFAHIAAPGPLPPLLVTGTYGCGKSLLLAKWMELQQQRSSSGIVLYHLVGSRTSCSADPVLMIRRLTGQLMQHVTSPPALTCDPVRLVEEFPRWLEKVSTKVPGGVVLVIDSMHSFQSHEVLKWLMDPLPVDLRVILSIHEDHCPQSWKSWPRLQLSELSNKNVRELLRAELASKGRTLSGDQERAILNHCNSAATCVPLYVILLANELARTPEDLIDRKLSGLLESRDTVDLYKILMECTRHEHEDPTTRGLIKKILELIYASRNGLTETELFAIVPELTWNFWAPVYETLCERNIIVRHCGILMFIHEQARIAIEEQCFSEEDVLRAVRMMLRDYYAQFQCNIANKLSQRPHEVTSRCSDELPWLNHMLDDKDSLKSSLSNLCIFVKLYGRGGCGELISHWQYAGVDKSSVAKIYIDALKYMESMVGQCDGLVTLPRIADVYEALGRFLRDIGLLTEALTPLQRALEIREMALDPDHPAVAQTLHQVAGLHAQQGKFSTAEALYKQALDIYEGALGREHFLIAKELDALAVLYQKQGKHEHSEPLRRRALSIRRKCGTPRMTTDPIRSIDPLKKRVLQLEELVMGPNSVDLARTLNELGVLYYLQNNIHTAETFFRRALEMRESVVEEGHPLIAQSLNNLAALHNDRKQYELAEPLYQRALQIRLKHYGQDHQAVASIINQLAMLYKKMGKLTQAEPLYCQSVEIRERSFGEHHPAVATALVNLAVLHSQQGHHAEAEPLYNKALQIYEQSFGPNHARVAETLKNLALLKYEQGEYETAAKLYKRAMDIKENDPAYAAKAAATSSGRDNLHVQVK